MVLLLLCGCVQSVVKPVNLMEYIGVQGRDYLGKVWVSESLGDGWSSYEGVREVALKNAAKKTKELGYDFFSILSEENKSSVHNVTLTTYMPSSITNTEIESLSGGWQSISSSTSVPVNHTYRTVTPRISIVFIVVEEKELHLYKNIFSVSDYINE